MMECGNVLQEADGFEPQQRARSNTWPLPRPENFLEIKEEPGQCQEAGTMGSCLPDNLQGTGTSTKKNSSRRNAWGNLSYADLITQAITTAPEKRLTLSQIYEYMVQNVPYFKDKGDSNSSAGWKNSIRHNLSLHNRFMRVQNEGTGKSSWWMINPDAKPGKSARRRATSMETSKFEKRRGRVKKKVEALRNGLTLDHTPSPSSSVSEGLDLFPDSPLHSASGFQLSPDFRPRASSNASSCGRLSPIPSVLGEPDWSSAAYSNQYGPEQLAGNLAEGMKLHQAAADSFCMGYSQPPPPPPPYTSPYETGFTRLGALHAASPYGVQRCPVHRVQPCTCLQPGMSPSYPQSEPSPDPQFAAPSRALRRLAAPGEAPGPRTPSTMMGQLMGALNNSTLLDDLNLNIETLHGGFDCNVEEVIKHELSMDGSLDFNFTGGQSSQAMTSQESQQQAAMPPYSTSVATGHWVH